MTDSVEDFLDSRRGQGKLESEGDFTMKAAVVREKASRYTLQKSGDWAVKIVQALLASQLEGEIKIRLHRHYTEFRFQLCEPWDMEKTKELVFGRMASSGPAMKHLECGLLAVAVGQSRPVEIGAFSGGRVLKWNGEALESGQASSPKSMWIKVQHVSKAERLMVVQTWRSVRKKRILDALCQLRDRILFAEVPIILDGRRMDFSQQVVNHLQANGSIAPLFAWTQRWKEENWFLRLLGRGHGLAQKVIQHQDLAALRCLTIKKSLLQKVFETPDGQTIFSQNHKSRIWWICDGVVVGEDPIPLHGAALSVQIFADAQDLDLDLSGLAVRDGPERRARQRELEEKVRKEILGLSPKFWYKTCKSLSSDSDRIGGIAGFGYGVAAVYFLGPYLPLVKLAAPGLLSAFTLAGTALGSRDPKAEAPPELRGLEELKILDREFEKFRRSWIPKH